MTILYAEVRPRLSGEEAELCVLRFTGCVRDAPQRVRHLHALEHRKQKKEKIIIINNKIDKFYIFMYVNLRTLFVYFVKGMQIKCSTCSNLNLNDICERIRIFKISNEYFSSRILHLHVTLHRKRFIVARSLKSINISGKRNNYRVGSY